MRKCREGKENITENPSPVRGLLGKSEAKEWWSKQVWASHRAVGQTGRCCLLTTSKVGVEKGARNRDDGGDLEAGRPWLS